MLISEAIPQINISLYTVNNTNIATTRNLRLAFGGNVTNKLCEILYGNKQKTYM
jgi:hypothetical protein